MKDKLRQQMLGKRNSLSQEELLKKSRHIQRRLLDLREYQQAHIICFYVSYGHEVFTHELIKRCLMKGKQVVVPLSHPETHTLSLSLLKKWDDLAPGTYHILEPKKEAQHIIDVGALELIIVPGVAFDYKGNRIGHGKGYYDNLLTTTNALSIGLAFEFQLVESIPADSHDIAVDMIITEKRIVHCKVAN